MSEINAELKGMKELRDDLANMTANRDGMRDLWERSKEHCENWSDYSDALEAEVERLKSVAPNGTPKVKHHNETIVCPECNAIEHATVMHTVPWYSYVHECTKCGYIVMESDWTLAEPKEEAV